MDFDWFIEKFLAYSGVNLHLYKRPQMERRLTTLCQRRGFSSFREYWTALLEDSNLYNEFVDKITINVSEFFRNPERWDDLMSLFRPPTTEPTRVWSAACSTGEEPYTLAMLLQERKLNFEILATDIDQRALNAAEHGEYFAHQIRQVPERFSHFLIPDQGRHAIHPAVKEGIHFKRHNLLHDNYPKSMHLIVCRNVLIYFTEEGKRYILERFSSSLAPGGLLFVGSTEQFFYGTEYELKSVAPFIYQKQ